MAVTPFYRLSVKITVIDDKLLVMKFLHFMELDSPMHPQREYQLWILFGLVTLTQ